MTHTVSVPRSLWDDPTFRDSEMSQREAWIWMIAAAASQPRTARLGAHEVALDRGQLAGSTRSFAQVFLWSHTKARRFLEMIENRHMIERVTDTGLTVITICKYDDYQSFLNQTGTAAAQRPAQQRHSSGTPVADGRLPLSDPQQATSTPAKRKARKPALRMPEGAVISDQMLDAARRAGLCDDEARAQFQRFKDRALAQGAAYADWDAAWRNWLCSPYFKTITNGGRHDRSCPDGGIPNGSRNRSDPALEQIARITGFDLASGYGRA
ncbi:hypothetical protein [Paracoccus sp. (in: a-proteobacteria)]|uniref:hypothetical protein n=1 Tax=Paracoccus sp. TaxID=267 RepID=UPI003A8BC415